MVKTLRFLAFLKKEKSCSSCLLASAKVRVVLGLTGVPGFIKGACCGGNPSHDNTLAASGFLSRTNVKLQQSKDNH